MSTSRINLSTTEYVQINTSYGPLIIEALAGDVHVVLNDSKPAVSNIAFHKLTDRQRLTFDRLNTNVWALGKNATSQATVTQYSSSTGWPWLDLANGYFAEVDSVKKFGRNPAVGTSYVPVSLNGVYRTPQSTSATALRVAAGGNANDTVAGSGAHYVTLAGLDENFQAVSERVALAGASASAATTTTFTRLYRCYVDESGSYANATTPSHANTIIIENAAGTEEWARIDGNGFPKGQTEIGAFTIPTGKYGYVKLRNLSINSGKTVDMVFFSRANCNQTTTPYSAMRAQSVVSGVTGGSIEVFGQTDVPFGPYTGPTDVGFMARVGVGTASVSVEFEIVLVDI